MLRRLAPLLAVGALGCADDLRTSPLADDAIWNDDVSTHTPTESIDYRDRSTGVRYDLPADGMTSIADVIDLFPTSSLDSTDPDIFVAPGLSFPTDQCRGGAPRVVDDLPLTFEGVVTLYPRQYMKVTICGQDERQYGVFTVEDDTGGIVVVRDGRAAPYSFGDRVRVTVRALALTFGREVDTRVVLVSDIERLPNRDPYVAFSPLTDPYGADQIGRVQQIEGWVHVVPTSLNFNAMIVTDEPFSRRDASETFTGELLSCVRTCEVRCQTRCPSAEACSDICPDICISSEGETPESAELPACWNVSVDTELGRRGFAPEYGQHLRARGPIVNNFDVQMWVNSPGQVDLLP
ncbi:MAG: hypothetical protein H6699_07400 [Myxococcales bacterium]|nr:hypothetical protein [Myxococcales bacterium]